MTARSHESTKPNNGSQKPPNGTPAATPSRTGAAEAWQQQLVQKDELIQALTEQLEQAAEQLDRLQRSGADRRRGGAGGGSPIQSEEQRRTFEDLQRVVQQWEDMQAGLTLGRIEIQISEIRELITDGLATQHAAPRRGFSGNLEIHEEPADLHGDESGHSNLASEHSVDSSWEKVKNQLLAGDDSPKVASEDGSEVEQPLREPPTACDLETATHEHLALAVNARDEYISYLLSRLRHLEALQPAAELAKLDVAGEEFAERVKLLERKLQEHLRCAEVEMSVERAKIARDRAQLVQQQELIDRQLRKLGLNTAQDLEQAIGQAGNVQERRWARFLGRPKNE